MEQQNAVRALLQEMRATLANADGMPQTCVNSRVMELSQAVALIDPREIILPDIELRA